MDPNDNAKYLNSPETELFDKGRSLFNHGPAREAAGKGKPLIVAEGYMDVIALHRAGYRGAVAPLGTAVTEEQIGELWKMTNEPILCLDGDAAGKRAAVRAAERALPILRPGKSLLFSILPEGEDPDSYIRRHGPKRFATLLDGAPPLLDLLIQKTDEQHPQEQQPAQEQQQQQHVQHRQQHHKQWVQQVIRATRNYSNTGICISLQQQQGKGDVGNGGGQVQKQHKQQQQQ